MTTAIYLRKKNFIVICSNDKNINFYDIENKKLHRRFFIPEVQIFIDFSEEKNVLFTGTSSGIISCWDVDKILSN